MKGDRDLITTHVPTTNEVKAANRAKHLGARRHLRARWADLLEQQHES